MKNDRTYHKLKTVLEELDAVLFVVSRDELVEHLINLLSENRTTSISLTNESLLQELGLSTLLQGKINSVILPPDPSAGLVAAAGWKASVAETDAGLTSCYYIAEETGTLLMNTGSPDQRMVSLLPPWHIVVAGENQVMGTIQACFDKLQEEDQEHTNLFLCHRPQSNGRY